MQDRFEDLRTFVTVAQAGGFVAAAERLGIVKSAVGLSGYERDAVPLQAVLPAAQHVPMRVSAFIDFLVERFGDDQSRNSESESGR